MTHEEIARLIDDGVTPSIVARRAKISTSWARKIAARHGVYLIIPHTLIGAVRECVESGYTGADIGEELEVSAKTGTRWLRQSSQRKTRRYVVEGTSSYAQWPAWAHLKAFDTLREARDHARNLPARWARVRICREAIAGSGSIEYMRGDK